MSTNGTPTPAGNISQRARIKSALERIEALEQEFPRIIGGVNNGFMNVEGRLNETTEIMNAMAELIGQDSVAAKVAENRTKRAEATAAAQTEGLAKALADGKVAKVETISEKTIIIAKAFDKDGNLEVPGRIQMDFGQVKPEFREQFLGKSVGAILDTPVGGKLEVTELYEVVAPPPPAANTDAPAAETAPSDASATQPPAQA